MTPPPAHTIQLRDDLNELINWDVMDDSILEEEVFTSFSEINAMGQVITSTGADGSVHKPAFNHSGMLKKVDVQLKGAGEFQSFVSSIEYTEKGQRASISYGNGVKTSYEYHPLNYRLTRLKSSRSGNENLLQDLQYAYDPVGNLTRIEDKAQQTIYFDNQVVDAINEYSYDSFYQLKSATGREHIGQTALTSPNDQVNPANILPHKGDGQKMRNYERFFTYDKAGNMLLSHHQPMGTPAFKRHFEYESNNNRLHKSGIGQEQNWRQYNYDQAGNTQQLVHLNSIRWNYRDELQSIGKTGVSAYYEYNAAGERSRKIVQKGSNDLEVRYYLGDVEIFRKYTLGQAGIQSERESLHIMDDTRRVAMIDRQTIKDGKTIASNDQLPLYRYQLSNHLGSASIELDEKAKIISYEEYYPYGASSFQSVDKTREVPRKRYRYTGMERDEESGLNYHSARYYAPWLCRWLKPDPVGTVDGLNVYRFVKGNPVVLQDTAGTNSNKYPMTNKEVQLMIARKSVGDPNHVSISLKQFWQAYSGKADEVTRSKVELAMLAYQFGFNAGFAGYHANSAGDGCSGGICEAESELISQGLLEVDQNSLRRRVTVLDNPIAQKLVNEGYYKYFMSGVESGRDNASEWTWGDTLNLGLFFFGGHILKGFGSFLGKGLSVGSATMKNVGKLFQKSRGKVPAAATGNAGKMTTVSIKGIELRALTTFEKGVYAVKVLKVEGENLFGAIGKLVEQAKSVGAQSIVITSENIVNKSIQRMLGRGGKLLTNRGWKVAYSEVPYIEGVDFMVGKVTMSKALSSSPTVPVRIPAIPIGPAIPHATRPDKNR